MFSFVSILIVLHNTMIGFEGESKYFPGHLLPILTGILAQGANTLKIHGPKRDSKDKWSSARPAAASEKPLQ